MFRPTALFFALTLGCSGGGTASGGMSGSGTRGSTGTATSSGATGSSASGSTGGSDGGGTAGAPDLGSPPGGDLPPGWGEACEGHAQTHVGGVDARSNDDLLPLMGATCIQGSLLIQDAVTDLSPLAALQVVGGDLQFSAAALTNLQGLEALTRVAGSLRLGVFVPVPGSPCPGNPALADISALSSLEIIGADIQVCNAPSVTSLGSLGLALTGAYAGSIEVDDLPALTSLAGFENLQSVGGALRLTRLDGLVDLGALASLTTVGGPLSIEQNDALTGIDGLGALEQMGALSILDNPELASVQAMNALTTIDDGFYVMTNPKLPTAEVEALAGTITIGGDVVICGNAGGDPC